MNTNNSTEPTPLVHKSCVPCEGDTPRLGPADVSRLLPQLADWQVTDDNGRLRKRFTFPDFMKTIAFINRLADLAEAEGHHPDFAVQYNKLDVTIWTHAIGGLSENDFILAAKLDRLPRS